MNKIPKNSREKADFFYCERCKISSDTERRMCPCPRGGCEARIVAKVITTKEYIPVENE